MQQDVLTANEGLDILIGRFIATTFGRYPIKLSSMPDCSKTLRVQVFNVQDHKVEEIEEALYLLEDVIQLEHDIWLLPDINDVAWTKKYLPDLAGTWTTADAQQFNKVSAGDKDADLERVHLVDPPPTNAPIIAWITESATSDPNGLLANEEELAMAA